MKTNKNITLTKKQQDLIINNIDVVSKYVNYTIRVGQITKFEKDDLESECYYKLCRAAKLFNNKNKTAFATYANGSFRFAIKCYRQNNYKFNKNNTQLTKKIEEDLVIKKNNYLKWEKIENIVEKLDITDREKQVFIMRIRNEMPLAEVGKVIKRSKETVRLICDKVSKKLKLYIEKNNYEFEDFLE